PPGGWPYSVCIRPRSTHIRVFNQIFGLRELSFAWPITRPPPKTAIDAGANVGYATLAMKRNWPECRIVALEPDEGNFLILQENCRHFADVVLLRKGLWGTECHLALD